MPTPKISQGTKLYVSTNGTSYTEIPLLTSIGGPNRSRPAIDVTNLSDAARTYIAGMVENGQLTAQGQFSYSSATWQTIEDSLTLIDPPTLYFRLVLPNESVKFEFSGVFESFETTSSVGEVRTASFTIRISGVITDAPST